MMGTQPAKRNEQTNKQTKQTTTNKTNKQKNKTNKNTENRVWHCSRLRSSRLFVWFCLFVGLFGWLVGWFGFFVWRFVSFSTTLRKAENHSK
jgi:hypothetical protein